MLTASRDRFVLADVKHPDLWQLYQQALASFWTPNEVDLATDAQDWKRLSDDERFFVLRVLAFFASSDGIVNENLCQRFAVEVQWFEARCFYGLQICMENIHNTTYTQLIDTFAADAREREQLFHAIDDVPCVRRKAEWALQWVGSDSTFAHRLVAFAVVEGVFFSASFCAIFWLRKRGLMPGLTFSNELIARDEGMHTDFACLLYSKLEAKLPVEVVHAIVGQAVDCEVEFVRDALPVRLIGMNADMMITYIKFVADRLLLQLGVPRRYEATNPFEWMQLQSLQGRTNFFEKRVGEYQKAGVKERSAFSTLDDF
jgi:ribonucleotide reductase beta subunit family protein with ferritin-like domain